MTSQSCGSVPRSLPTCREGPPFSLLVVDDDEQVRKVLANRLSSQGHTVDTAADSQAAMKLADEGTYDVVVIEVRLQEESGLTVIPMLRRAGLDTPVVIFTGFDTDIDAFEAGRLGAAEYVHKGDGLDALVDALHRVTLQRSRDPLDLLAFRLERGASQSHNRQLRAEVISLTADQTIDVIAFRQACMATRLACQHSASEPWEIADTLRAAGRVRRRLTAPSAAILAALQAAAGSPSSEPEAWARQRLKQETQTSFRGWRNLARCQRVVRELAGCDEHVGQLAFRHGFKTHSQFTHLFTQLTGLAPRQVRLMAGRGER